MPEWSVEIVVRAESLEEAAALAESAADFLGALTDEARVEVVCLFDPE